MSYEQAAEATHSSPVDHPPDATSGGGLKPLTVENKLTGYGVTDVREDRRILAFMHGT